MGKNNLKNPQQELEDWETEDFDYYGYDYINYDYYDVWNSYDYYDIVYERNKVIDELLSEPNTIENIINEKQDNTRINNETT